jgi:hypothetical protein
VCLSPNLWRLSWKTRNKAVQQQNVAQQIKAATIKAVRQQRLVVPVQNAALLIKAVRVKVAHVQPAHAVRRKNAVAWSNFSSLLLLRL